MAITAAALVAMPVLAGLKRREARRSGNAALAADAVQSATCAYIALVALVGLAVNAAFHIAWFDSVAALAAFRSSSKRAGQPGRAARVDAAEHRLCRRIRVASLAQTQVEPGRHTKLRLRVPPGSAPGQPLAGGQEISVRALLTRFQYAGNQRNVVDAGFRAHVHHFRNPAKIKVRIALMTSPFRCGQRRFQPAWVERRLGKVVLVDSCRRARHCRWPSPGPQ